MTETDAPPLPPALLRISQTTGGAGRCFELRTREETRAIGLLNRVARGHDLSLHRWDEAQGLDSSGDPKPLCELLDRVDREVEAGILAVCGVDPDRLTSGELRTLRNFAQRSRRATVVFVQLPEHELGLRVPELEVLELPLPTRSELRHALNLASHRLRSHPARPAVDRLLTMADEIAEMACGLDSLQFERAVDRALFEDPTGVRVPAWLADHKAEFFVGGALQLMAPRHVEELGGMRELKTWLRRRARAFEPQARRAAIPAPRGILIFGVQGCGKSLAAQACAGFLSLPLVQFDVARVYGGTVGASESNLRDTLERIDRMSPAVLWLDEVDKALAGFRGQRSDAGTSARVLGTILTWLEEREEMIFVVATANDISALPPEFLRRGRFDELFFVDLPDAAARRDIVRIHLVESPARTLDPTPELADGVEAFERVASTAEGHTGAELEAAIAEARLVAYEHGRLPSANDLAFALEHSIPLSRSHAEQVSNLRAWAKTRARPADGDPSPVSADHSVPGPGDS